MSTTKQTEATSVGRLRANRELDIHENEHAEFMLLGWRRFIELLQTQATASIDDLRQVITIPASVRGVALGAIPRRLAKAGLIHRVGFIASNRPESHARPISEWALCDAAAARQWLIDNPAPILLTPPTVQRELFKDGGH